jgi:hypothetical protein
MAATRALLITVTRVIDSASDALLERIGHQLLDLMDVAIESAGVAPSIPCAKVVVLRATRVITQRLSIAI